MRHFVSSLRRMARLTGLALIAATALCSLSPVQAQTAATLAAAPTLKGLSTADIQVLADLYDAAVKSGKTVVNLYSPNSPVDRNTTLGISLREFQTTFPGITVLATRVAGAELYAKVEAEIASGNRKADLVGDPQDLLDAGWIESYEPPLGRSVPAHLHGPNGYFVSSSLKLFGLVYNTDLVKPGEAPRSIDELLSPKWKGKVTISQPTGTGTTDRALSTLLESKAIDAATIKRIADFIPSADRQVLASASVNTVAQGRYAFSLWAPDQVAAQLAERGAPIAIADFKEQVLINAQHGLLKGAPSPDAAKLLLNWLLTPAAQRIYAEKVYEYGTVPGSPQPKGLPDISGYSLVRIPEAKSLNVARGHFAATVKPVFGTPK